MATNVPGWTPEVERTFKEVLFRFLEEVHCTKAALYLLAPDDSYTLAAQYGFGRRDELASSHTTDHPLVQKVRQLRGSPQAVNEVSEILAEIDGYLQGAGTSRILLVPLYGASRILGFVDARDKGGKRPFETEDVHQASLIGNALVGLAERHGLYPDLGTAEGEKLQVPEEDDVRPSIGLRGLSGAARLDAAGLRELNGAAVDTVAREGVFAVAVTIATGDAAATVVYTGSTIEEVDTEAISRHQSEALVRAGIQVPHPKAWKVDLRRLPVSANRLRASLVATTVPLYSNNWALAVSTIGAEGGPSPATVLDRLRRVATIAEEMTALRFSRRALARRMLQPGDQKYPDLLAHSLSVSRLCWMMAQVMEYDDRSTEEAALAGLLHDVGMRELQYDRLYRHPAPSPVDRRTYRQHVVTGERILKDTGMDAVARAIRNHHERWDGKGYPDQMSGEAIPLLARLVHAAEVFDVLTSTSSYRPTVPTEQALATMRAATGQQFDPQMVPVLAQVVS
jgi:putative nucleotidyltransferase with HDIG domain